MPLHYFWADEKPCRTVAKLLSIPDGSVPLYLVIFHAFHDSIIVQKKDLNSCSLYGFYWEKVRGATRSIFSRLVENVHIFARPGCDLTHLRKTEDLFGCSDGVIFCKTCSILKVPIPKPPGTLSGYNALPLEKVALPERAMI
jgi:hypothetical protein